MKKQYILLECFGGESNVPIGTFDNWQTMIAIFLPLVATKEEDWNPDAEMPSSGAETVLVSEVPMNPTMGDLGNESHPQELIDFKVFHVGKQKMECHQLLSGSYDPFHLSLQQTQMPSPSYSTAILSYKEQTRYYQHDGYDIREIFYTDGTLNNATYKIDGKLHRLDGPAYVSFYEDGQLCVRQYCINNLNHRLDGPAYEAFHLTGKRIIPAGFYVHGKGCSLEELRAYLFMTNDMINLERTFFIPNEAPKIKCQK